MCIFSKQIPETTWLPAFSEILYFKIDKEKRESQFKEFNLSDCYSDSNNSRNATEAAMIYCYINPSTSTYFFKSLKNT